MTPTWLGEVHVLNALWHEKLQKEMQKRQRFERNVVFEHMMFKLLCWIEDRKQLAALLCRLDSSVVSSNCFSMVSETGPESSACRLCGLCSRSDVPPDLQGLLFVSAYSGLVEVPVANCSNYLSCGECVLSRDPYCAWTGRLCRDVRMAPPDR